MEMLDIRDEGGSVTGRRIERGAPLKNGEYILAVHVYIFNSHGFLIQKRSRQKKEFPGRWDITGGAVISGEDSGTAASREVREELGLCLKGSALKFVARLKRSGCLIDIWACRQDFTLKDIVMQPDEVDDVRFVPANEMMDILFGDVFCDNGYRAVMADFIKTNV
jgi:isopentenyldiphosphate isomerase